MKAFLLFLQIFLLQKQTYRQFPTTHLHTQQQVQPWSISHGFSHTATFRLLPTQTHAAVLPLLHTPLGHSSSKNFKSIWNEHPPFTENHPGFAPHHLQLNSLPSAWISSPPPFPSLPCAPIPACGPLPSAQHPNTDPSPEAQCKGRAPESLASTDGWLRKEQELERKTATTAPQLLILKPASNWLASMNLLINSK